MAYSGASNPPAVLQMPAPTPSTASQWAVSACGRCLHCPHNSCCLRLAKRAWRPEALVEDLSACERLVPAFKLEADIELEVGVKVGSKM